MRFVPFPPPPPLARHVELIWVLEGTPAYTREKVLPNGAVELIFNLGSPHKVVDRDDFGRFTIYRESWIAGMQAEPLVIEALRESRLVGVRFRPGGATPFLGFPVSELTGRVIECGEIFGRELDETRERLLESATAAERVRAVVELLASRLADAPAGDPLVDHALAKVRRFAEPREIGGLSRDLGLSHKQVIARFRRAVGLPPKLLQRIYRFQAVIDAAKGRDRVSWADLAARCGYYDQAHLARDFRLLGGITPGEYLRRRDADENHVIVD